MQKFRLLALDIDGTLLDDDKQLPEANRVALNAAVEAGVVVAIATGRMTPRIEPIAERLGIDVAILAYNGGKIVGLCAAGRPVLHHQPVPADVAEFFIHYSQRTGTLLNFYHDEVLYSEDGPRRRPFIDLYARRTGAKYHIEPDLQRLIGTEPTKLILLAEPDEVARLRAEFQVKFAGRAFITTSEPEYLEIMAPGVNKGYGLAVLARAFDVPVDLTVAVGDAANDVELLQSAGLGVAVASATEELKKVADAVTTATNNEGAVAEVVERWILPEVSRDKRRRFGESGRRSR